MKPQVSNEPPQNHNETSCILKSHHRTLMKTRRFPVSHHRAPMKPHCFLMSHHRTLMKTRRFPVSHHRTLMKLHRFPVSHHRTLLKPLRFPVSPLRALMKSHWSLISYHSTLMKTQVPNEPPQNPKETYHAVLQWSPIEPQWDPSSSLSLRKTLMKPHRFPVSHHRTLMKPHRFPVSHHGTLMKPHRFPMSQPSKSAFPSWATTKP
jgi:hypothetical protein